MTHVQKSVSMQQHFEQFVGIKKTKRKVFGYFWSSTTKAGPRKETEGVGTMAPLVEKMWGHFFI